MLAIIRFLSALLAAAAPLLAQQSDPLLAAFSAPPAEARPFVRWWWNGNRITAEEIQRQLDVLAAAGVGGVEINPIAFPGQARDVGAEPVPWLSPKWNRLLRLAADGARERGMMTDLIVGSGWPFGGRFLEPGEQIRILRVREVELAPDRPHRLELDELVKFGKGRRGADFVDEPSTRLQFLKVVPRRCASIDDVEDVTSRVEDGVLVVPPAAEARSLFVGAVQAGFRLVVHGAPGADGPVLDHFNREAVEKYLARMSDRLGPVLGGDLGDSLRAMFCDSIELGGADWTGDLPDEFTRRRGYDLGPWLPFVASEDAGKSFGHLAADIELAPELADEVRRVRYDYSRTLCELFEERFIRPFHAWCHAHGTRSRYQAYGLPWLYGMLDGYLVPDIPEGDLWIHFTNDGVGERLDDIRYAVWNKYASSGAHLTGKRLVACEAITNLQGVFRATLEDLKQAADLNFMTGSNHSILHGFNYSPKEAGFPGWIRYGTYLSDQNPWWPYFRLFSEYHARIAAVLQASQPVAQVAILGPRADVWSDHGLVRAAFIGTPPYLHELWQSFQQNGTTADFVDHRILADARVDHGRLGYGPMHYALLVVVEAESLEPAAAEAIARFAEAGGRVAFVGRTPSRAPSLRDAAANDARVEAAMERALGADGGRAEVVAAPGDEPLIGWTGRLLTRFRVPRSLRIDDPDARLFQVHHRAGERDVLFVTNLDRVRTIATKVTLDPAKGNVERWDPETGERRRLGVRPDGRLALVLSPLESALLIVGPGEPVPPAPEGAAPTEVAELDGPWQVEFLPMAGAPFERRLEELFDLGGSDDEALQVFAGTVVYRRELPSELVDEARWLDLGAVHGVSEVHWNGESLGTRWWGTHRYELPGAAHGPVALEIRVTTTAANHARSLDDPTARRWTRSWKDKTPAKAGLVGPVRLLR